MKIDFIAGHPLQGQGAQAVAEALADRAQCRWQIGRPISYTGAEAAVLIDHVHHHPDFLRWPWRFYMLHDLGDIDVYVKERVLLRHCTAVIVPDDRHAQAARTALTPRWYRRGPTIFTGGWAKYDGPSLSAVNRPLARQLAALPDRPTVLYAPSWAGVEEWRSLLPLLAVLPVNVVIKNHPYATAPGEEVSEFYRQSKVAVSAMEKAARTYRSPMIVAPADLNICLLFPYATAAISDQSSVLAEFLPWGASFETGANPDGPPQRSISRWYPEVIYRPVGELTADLRHGGRQLLADIAGAKKHDVPRGAGQRIADMIWERICE